MNKSGLKFDYHDFNKKKLIEILSNYNSFKKNKIIYFSTYKINYTRTEYLFELFKELKIDFEIVHSQKKGLLKYIDSLIKLIKEKEATDLILVSFRGHEILPFVKLLFPKKTIIFDAFISVYDTLCFDRQIFKPKSLIGRFLKNYDKFLCKISDLVLLDTKTHANYFEQEFKCKNVDYLYVGCNRKMFYPRKKIAKRGGKFIVFWYGYGNPLQGADVILKAAAKLKNNKNIIFIIGGPIENKYKQLIKELNLTNVSFIGKFPYKELPNLIDKADLCLGGHFSNLPKAMRVIPGKVFQFFEMNKRIVLGDCPANRELFHKSKNISFVKPNSDIDLFEKININLNI